MFVLHAFGTVPVNVSTKLVAAVLSKVVPSTLRYTGIVSVAACGFVEVSCPDTVKATSACRRTSMISELVVSVPLAATVAGVVVVVAVV
jgi:hypothetical protein